MGDKFLFVFFSSASLFFSFALTSASKYLKVSFIKTNSLFTLFSSGLPQNKSNSNQTNISSQSKQILPVVAKFRLCFVFVCLLCCVAFTKFSKTCVQRKFVVKSQVQFEKHFQLVLKVLSKCGQNESINLALLKQTKPNLNLLFM